MTRARPIEACFESVEQDELLDRVRRYSAWAISEPDADTRQICANIAAFYATDWLNSRQSTNIKENVA